MSAAIEPIKVCSIHWGFSIGGVAQYAAVLERSAHYASIQIASICILDPHRHIDKDTLSKLGNLTIVERRNILDVRWVRVLASIVDREKPDLVFTHGFNGHFAAFVVRHFIRHTPRFIASYHGRYHPPTRMKRAVEGLYNWFTEYYLRKVVVHVVSVAEFCREYLLEKGVSSRKIVVIHNGIPDITAHSDAAELRGELGIGADAFVVGVVSRLDPEKGIEYLLRAFAQIASEWKKAQLLVIGTGAQEGYLRRLANGLDIGNRVSFAGFRANAARYLPALDIFVLPSLAEYHSIGLLEAMRAGRAILATDVGGNTESIRDGVEGVVVKPGNVADLANALQEMIGNADLRARLGANARARFEVEFRVSVMTRRTAEFLVWVAEKNDARLPQA